ncbi:unnamed protein product [Rotaria magnacalcarata]|uniref:SH2 domain-containing protein n=2 Tax=Rotaria magnacalcarata TaxID=392030 RepID=A0A817A1J3_9BILA|nr:unnamed protein product [Rotaria magnacalcarata]CAF2247859.1 unnamed protein product [Rotaria magnacalcarata]CAF3839437.1 unnamed protein product [Rotaria magnacalcarata]CAF4238969.1 unnamed protein product [Rotaria magnacalcarata]
MFVGDDMSTVCCLTIPSSHYSLISPSSRFNSTDVANEQNRRIETTEENYSIIANQHLSPMVYSNNSPISTRTSQEQQQHPLLLVAEEVEVFDTQNQTDNDKLLLPRSTRSLKRRSSLFEKSRDWARRLITLHRIRRNAISNEKIRESCFEFDKRNSIRKNSYHGSLYNYPKNFDEDGYLSPMEIQAKLDNISKDNKLSYSKSSTKLSEQQQQQQQQLLVYSQSGSDLPQSIYRCHGPIMQKPILQCTCQPRLPSKPLLSEFHKSLSIVDYIDFDVPDSSTKQDENNDNDDDPLCCLKYLFNENIKKEIEQNGNFVRRTPRRSTNTSSISADSGYCDIPTTTTTTSSSSSKLIPVHLVSCRLIPVNVTRTKSMDIHCITCTCPTSSQYFSNKTERHRRKSSTHSHLTYSRQHMDIIENEINNCCSCNNKYYSTMTICPALSVSSSMGTKSTTKIDGNHKDDYYHKQQKKHLRKKRTSLLKLPLVNDDLTPVSRWYKPYLEREAVCQVLQSADYGAFILRNSTTHSDCYALSVKVPKFTHDSNIAHYLIERIVQNDTPSYRIKGTIKQFPTLLSLLTHHSVMPEILPITLNLNEILSI